MRSMSHILLHPKRPCGFTSSELFIHADTAVAEARDELLLWSPGLPLQPRSGSRCFWTGGGATRRSLDSRVILLRRHECRKSIERVERRALQRVADLDDPQELEERKTIGYYL